MVYLAGTSIAKMETTVPTIPALREHVCETSGEIPPNLAAMTMLLLQVHAANGDIPWVVDMIDERFEVASASPKTTKQDPLSSMEIATLRGEMMPETVEALLNALVESCGVRNTGLQAILRYTLQPQ